MWWLHNETPGGGAAVMLFTQVLIVFYCFLDMIAEWELRVIIKSIVFRR